MKLYHYVHCPFCVRVRMALGALEIKYESIVLPYHDEKTPIDLCQKKMLPIFEWSENERSNESLEIIKRLDTNNQLKTTQLSGNNTLEAEINDILNTLGKPIHNLAMPYWIWTPEFDDKSREYFVAKKSVKRGPFNKLAQNKDQYVQELKPLLNSLHSRLEPFVLGEPFSVFDIMIASHLWGLYIVPEFQFPTALHKYLQAVGRICNFDYHHDFWK